VNNNAQPGSREGLRKSAQPLTFTLGKSKPCGITFEEVSMTSFRNQKLFRRMFSERTLPSKGQDIKVRKEQELKTNEAICKMNLDLWTHQNTLMWSRLHVLWFIQFGFLSVSKNTNYAACFGALITAMLWIVMNTDRQLRNVYRKKIETCELQIYPASVKQEPIHGDLGTNVLEPLFHTFIFISFILVDLYVGGVILNV
jgi:hypothetical protein